MRHHGINTHRTLGNPRVATVKHAGLPPKPPSGTRMPTLPVAVHQAVDIYCLESDAHAVTSSFLSDFATAAKMFSSMIQSPHSISLPKFGPTAIEPRNGTSRPA